MPMMTVTKSSLKLDPDAKTETVLVESIVFL